MKILAIETSCDETALAIVECDGSKNIKFKVLAEEVASQIKIHRPYGGVVPMLAKREHEKNLPILLEKILGNPATNSRNKLEIDKIAVTIGPGLEPALWAGLIFAKNLGDKLGAPVIGVNHLEGHLFSNWIPVDSRLRGNDITEDIKFPAIVLLVSGGHTTLLKMESLKKWTKLGETCDDAVGETFDKVAKMLGLPYPGGPEIEKMAEQFGAKKTNIKFARPMLNSKNYDFSFSGLKTSVLYFLRDNFKLKKGSSIRPNKIAATIKLSASDIQEVAAAFQQAAIEVLVKKTLRAVKEFEAKSILLCGGVAANKALRGALANEILRLRPSGSAQDDMAMSFFAPDFKYNLDNAVMIGLAACMGNEYPIEKPLPDLDI